MSSSCTPNVSIIVPIYNRANYILRCLNSIWDQTYKDYEIIIVDDGSSDNVKEIICPYMKSIRYIYQNNQGVAAARNTGISLARGNWIAFLDSDDIWLPNKLEEQIACLTTTKTNICFTEIAYVNNAPKSNIYNNYVSTKRRLKANPLYLVLNKALYVQTMIIEKKLLDSSGKFNTNLAVTEDTDFIYRLTNKTDFFLFINDPLVVIERSPLRQGLTYANKNSHIFSILSGIKILLNIYMECNNPDNNCKSRYITRLLRKKISYFLSRKAEILCAYNKYQEAKITVRDALYFDPNFKTFVKGILIILFTSYMGKKYYCKYSS